jgi:hypothetical protein
VGPRRPGPHGRSAAELHRDPEDPARKRRTRR